MNYLLAVSKAQYRGVLIWETHAGCSIFIGGKQYDFLSLEEATAFIDACFANVVTAN